MPFPSVTYTFSNGTLADATQVNQDFTDVINGMSDGTKSMNISALTAGGTATLSGSVTLGGSSANTLAVTASLNSSIPISTTNSFDIGSDALGLRSIYLGSGSSAHSTRLIGASVSSAWTLTLPTTAGSARQRLETDGSGTTSWQPVRHSGYAYDNGSLAASVGTSALTITYKDASGSSLSATNPSDVVFRSSTAATGSLTTDSATSNVTVTVPSGATLGHASGINNYIFIYLLDNAGTIELAVSSTLFTEGSIQTTTALTSGSTSAGVLYSTSNRTGVGVRLIGRMLSNQVTAGTWALVPTEISMAPFAPPTGQILAFQAYNANASTYYLGTGGGLLTTETFVALPVPYACIVTGIYANVNGNAGTKTLTVRKNFADTTMTCSMAPGATTANDITHQFAMAAGDSIDIKFVNSVSDSAMINCSVSILRI